MKPGAKARLTIDARLLEVGWQAQEFE